MRRPTLLIALVALILPAACQKQPPAKTDVPAPPSIVAAPPSAPVVADEGKPGSWEPVGSVSPAGRLFVVEPSGADPQPGILLVHAQWGVCAELRQLARDLAARGFVVAAPDVFDGVEASSRISAPELMNGVDRKRAQALLAAGLARLQQHARVKGKPVSLLAVGSGGAWAAPFAAGGATLAAAVFDSSPLYSIEGFPGQLKAPVMLVFGSDSSAITADRVGQIKSALDAAKIRFTPLEVRDAGNDLLDPLVIGFSRQGYDTALQGVAEFLKKL